MGTQGVAGRGDRGGSCTPAPPPASAVFRRPHRGPVRGLHNRMVQPPATSQDPIRAAVTAAFGAD